jgi:hypothetical protein
LLVWTGLAIYVELNKAKILGQARAAVKDRVQGDVRIGALDISFFRDFPSITVRLSDVSLRDSAWQQHHHDLLKATDVYFSGNVWKSLFTWRVQLGKITVEHAQIYLYTDSTGYSNTYLLRSRRPGNASASGKPDLPDISLNDVRWVMERQDKHKLFDLDIHRLSCTITRDDRQLHISVDHSDIAVNNFAFNTEKGSFIKGKTLSGNFAVDYNTTSKIIQLKGTTVQIDGHPFVFTGRLFPTVAPDPFILTIETAGINFKQASALLTPNLQQKLDQYDIDKPVDIHVQLDAGAADDPEPQIQVKLNLDKGSVQTPTGRFTDVSFKGSFLNEWIHGQKRGDENSVIRLLAFSGQLQGLPLQCDSIVIVDLKFPRMTCDLHSRFDLEQLNEVTGSQTLQFTNGSGTMDLLYKGPLSENDTAGTVVNGHLDIDSAALVYLPYQFKLSNGKGRLLFKDQDLVVEQINLHAGSSRVTVKGIARNLVALLDRNAENVSMDWSLSTPSLDLEDLLPLAGRVSPSQEKRGDHSLLGAPFSRIDRLLKEGAIKVAIDAADLHFRKFSGAHARADLVFDNHAIQLSRLVVEQGGGSLELKASLDRQGAGEASPLRLESHLDHVDLPRLFTAFNDFGQEAIKAKNLRGNLTADIRMTGALSGKAKVIPNSLRGTVNFTIRNGQLVDFEPIEKVQASVLKHRDLSEIRFAELQDRLEVDSTTLTIHRMEINSTAFTLFAEGTYDLKTGADMSLQVPFSNLSKDRNQDIPPESRGNEGSAGPGIRLRARTGEDGKLKISWDPFKKALKNVRKMRRSRP